jgi:hydrogenase maturation protease
MSTPRVTVLGVGNVLFADEGFGIRVIEQLQGRYEFPDEVQVIDGGVLGLSLLGIISEPQHLIVVDAVRSTSKPGSMYRLEGDQIPQRILAKNSLHQVDLLEALTLCEALGNVPQAVILGVEPEDMESLKVELTPVVQAQVEPMVAMVLDELDRLKVRYTERSEPNVFSHTL